MILRRNRVIPRCRRTERRKDEDLGSSPRCTSGIWQLRYDDPTSRNAMLYGLPIQRKLTWYNRTIVAFPSPNKCTKPSFEPHEPTYRRPWCNFNSCFSFLLVASVVLSPQPSRCNVLVFHDEKEERRLGLTISEPLRRPLISQSTEGNTRHVCQCGHNNCTQTAITL